LKIKKTNVSHNSTFTCETLILLITLIAEGQTRFDNKQSNFHHGAQFSLIFLVICENTNEIFGDKNEIISINWLNPSPSFYKFSDNYKTV
jgi:hypothetical protein